MTTIHIIRPPKMVALLLPVHLLKQCLLHLHSVHLTDLPAYLTPPQLMSVLILEHNIST